jgi:glycosyltransferase involved in cell wall biosynthesis
MSGSILEAMAFGLPVLATRVGGAAEVIEDGVNGWLYEPNDLVAAIEGLTRVAALEDAAIRTLGVAAAARVSRDHDRTTALARMTELLQCLSAGTLPHWLAEDPAGRAVQG